MAETDEQAALVFGIPIGLVLIALLAWTTEGCFQTEPLEGWVEVPYTEPR